VYTCWYHRLFINVVWDIRGGLQNTIVVLNACHGLIKCGVFSNYQLWVITFFICVWYKVAKLTDILLWRTGSLNKFFISTGDVSCHLKFWPKIRAYSTTVVIFCTHYCICTESSCFKMLESVFSTVILNKSHSIYYKCSGQWSLNTSFWLAWLGIWRGKGRFTATK
jgi:hypothetical protein